MKYKYQENEEQRKKNSWADCPPTGHQRST